MSLDISLFESIYNFAGKSSFLDSVGIFFADYAVFVLIIVAIVFIFLAKKWQTRFYRFATIALAGIIARGIVVPVLKFLIERPRPYEEFLFRPLIEPLDSFAFPSGHASFAFAFAAALYFLNRKLGIWMGIVALLIGVSRVFVGVHWPLDIVVGAFIGIASAIFTVQKLRERKAPVLKE